MSDHKLSGKSAALVIFDDFEAEAPLPLAVMFRRLVFVRVTLRQDARCWKSGALLARGERAWRPISNGKNRMRRIGDEAVRSIIAKGARVMRKAKS